MAFPAVKRPVLIRNCALSSQLRLALWFLVFAVGTSAAPAGTIGGYPIDATLAFTTPNATVSATASIPVYVTLSLASDSTPIITDNSGSLIGLTVADFSQHLVTVRPAALNLNTDVFSGILDFALICDNNNFASLCDSKAPYNFSFNETVPSAPLLRNASLQPGTSVSVLFGTFIPSAASAPPGTYTLPRVAVQIYVYDDTLPGRPLIAIVPPVADTLGGPAFTRTVSAAATANSFFDPAGRLVKVDYGSSGVVLYTYDKTGNLITRQVQPAAVVSPTGPTITSVSNSQSGSPAIAPNTWAAIYGKNLAPAGDPRTWQSQDFANNQMPTQLDGVSVTVNGKSAFVSYISPTQVNILTPPDPMSASVPVQLTTGGATSPAYTAQAQQISPSFFTYNGGPYVLAAHANGSIVGPTSLSPGATPAAPGETILLFGNGFGITSPPVTNASLAQAGGLPALPAITIGGLAATVQYGGLISPGLYQFNVVVPATASNGDNPVTATYNGSKTQTGVLITVQR